MKAIPTTREIYNQIEKDLKNKLNLEDTELKLVVDAIAAVFSGQLKLVYLYLYDIQKNSFPDTADPESEGGMLSRLGYIFLGRYPFPASDGYYKAVVTGVEGSKLRNQLTFKSNDEALNVGKMFILDSEYTLVNGENIITVRSLESGLESLLNVGDKLNITEPVLGVDSVITIKEVVTRPTSPESTDDYRQKILDIIQIEPFGGARGDYRIWASDARGVKRVYPYVKENDSGTVQIYVEATTDDSVDGEGTPSLSLMDEVKDVIELDPDQTKPINERGHKPIQANIEVLPISVRYVTINIGGLNNRSEEEKSNLFNGLKDYIKTVRPFIQGADLDRDRNDILSSGQLQGIALDNLDRSNYFNSFTMYVDGNVETQFKFSRANIPVLQDITYS